ncbi:nucleoside triphosphate pyrophosphohydrolase [Limoniibacter endophyticus]|uniref:Nucleoside triphosphate pyrophosphohydrolase n=1 Tax=Limoniibacter endophyticus TaxID=1565040 RepID=A0A8J3DFP6_9HYPH|nr:nucleoside triphosphate pyrophosphohydrolase [Limoniibacter endophyticus]GHC61899.1 nucleoside triphosphate pyrophosphohydrolase [Limoniibacter endophyticus]
MKASKEISSILDIMRALRDPENGCPWDVEQTFASIIPYTIEEAYEVADAVERNDLDDLREELGDLLLQVVFHARMAEEMGKFDFGDVVEAVSSKMIRRHPHVFGTPEDRERGLYPDLWDSIKAQEKRDRAARRADRDTLEADHKHLLADVPRALPALTRALKLQTKAAKVGFDWSEADPILAKIQEEIDELKEARGTKDQKRISEEYGDLLFAVVNLGRHLGVDAENALAGTNSKFINRFSYIEDALAQEGRTPQEATLNEMERHWQDAKQKANPQSRLKVTR